MSNMSVARLHTRARTRPYARAHAQSLLQLGQWLLLLLLFLSENLRVFPPRSRPPRCMRPNPTTEPVLLGPDSR